MNYKRFLLLVENFQTGQFMSLGACTGSLLAEQVRDFINDFVGNARLMPDQEPELLVWVKDRDTGEVY